MIILQHAALLSQNHAQTTSRLYAQTLPAKYSNHAIALAIIGYCVAAACLALSAHPTREGDQLTGVTSGTPCLPAKV